MSTAFINNNLRAPSTSYLYAWVGARAAVPGTGAQEGARFVWGSGDNMTLPNAWNWNRSGDCLQVDPANSYGTPLFAVPCSIRRPYVCEYEP